MANVRRRSQRSSRPTKPVTIGTGGRYTKPATQVRESSKQNPKK